MAEKESGSSHDRRRFRRMVAAVTEAIKESPEAIPPIPPPIKPTPAQETASWIGRLAQHPILPIALGAVLTWDGPIWVRQLGIVVMAIWLFADLHSSWRSSRRGYLRSPMTPLVLSLGLCGLAIFLIEHQNQIRIQQQTDEGLNLFVQLPRDGNPFRSIFTVTNSGPNTLSQHNMTCVALHLIDGYTGTDAIVNGPINMRGADSTNGILHPNGDADTMHCLGIVNFHRPTCLDYKVTVDYEIASQPGKWRHKEFRFISEYQNDFEWYKTALSNPKSPCDGYVNKPS